MVFFCETNVHIMNIPKFRMPSVALLKQNFLKVFSQYNLSDKQQVRIKKQSIIYKYKVYKYNFSLYYRSRLAAESPLQKGTIVHFCRERGHGFVKPDDEEKPLFLHISE